MEVGDERDQISIRDAIIPCTSTNLFIVLLPVDGFHFAGAFRFQCLYGSIKVAGYTQNGANFDQERFIPFATHNKAQIPLAFVPATRGIITAQDEEFVKRASFICEGDVAQLNYADRYAAAIVVDVQISCTDAFLSNRLDNYTKPLDRFKYVNVAAECYIVQGVKSASIIESLPPYISHKNIVHDAMEFVQRNGYSLMVTGAKGAGKSTMNRYIANRFLSRKKAVFLLDTDIGQTEFTPPGCVTLTRVETPLLTPPFLHQTATFYESICLGTLSPSNCIDEYYNAIERLFSRYQEFHNADTILLINSHGWIEGLGITIMRQLIQKLRPTLILNMYMEHSANLEIALLDQQQQFLQYHVVPRTNEMTARAITPRVWREFTITGYFAMCLGNKQFGEPSPQRTLANVNCYQVAFEKVALHIHRDRPYIKDHLILAGINCSIVALCAFQSSQDKKEAHRRYMCNNPELPVIVESANARRSLTFRCFGFGFIRAISPERRLVYIISPITPEMCANIEVLLVPNCIHTPVYMLDRDASNLAPYLVRKYMRECTYMGEKPMFL